jgi:hypothetical protein
MIAPKRGFIREFMDFMYFTTDAPLVFSLGTALAVLSSYVDPEASINLSGPVYAHNYVMLVGASGRSRKTACLGHGMKLIKHLDPHKVLSAPESEAGLLEALGALMDGGSALPSAQAMLEFGEFGAFLAGTTNGSYKQSLRTRLMDIWDGSTQSRKTVRDELIVENPRLSMLAGCAPSLLENYTTTHDWQGGFISRFMVMYGRRERLYPLPDEMNVARRDRLLAHLLYKSQQPCGTCVGWEPEAKKFFVSWSHSLDKKFDTSNKNTGGIRSRVPVIALKVAMVYSFDFGPAQLGKTWLMPLDIISAACAVADIHADSCLFIVSTLVDGQFGKQRKNVLHYLKDDYQEMGSILARMAEANLAMSKRDLKGVLETLKEEKKVEELTKAGLGVWYRLIPEVLEEPEAATTQAKEAAASMPARPEPQKTQEKQLVVNAVTHRFDPNAVLF